MEWPVEFTDEFGRWWEGLAEEEQESVAASVSLLEKYGPTLHMRELRIQHHGKPYRVLYAFDPLRVGILLIGGDKTGNERWYEEHVPIADRLYDGHVDQID
jgi:hypothetical protein